MLRFGLSSYPPTLAPWINAGTAAGTVQLMMNRGLLSYAPDGSLQGELAESWGRDGNAWVFKLREASFHDGTPVRAEDVKWSMEQVAAEIILAESEERTVNADPDDAQGGHRQSSDTADLP